MLTPWGMSQSKHKLTTGVYSVTTASHGGLLVGKRVARERLSIEAIKEGEPFAQYLAYEEDCAYAAVYADWPDLYRREVETGLLIPPSELGLEPTDDAIRAYYLLICIRWLDGYKL